MPVTKAQAKKLLDPDWVRAADVPDVAARYAETYVKKRVRGIEDDAVIALARLYRDTWRAMRDEADDLPISGRAAGQWAALAQRHVEAMRQSLREIALRGIVRGWYTGYSGRAWLLDSITTVPVAYRPPAPERIAADTDRLMHEDVYTDLIRTLPNTGALWQQYDNELDDLLMRVRTAIFTGMNAGEGIDAIMRRVKGVLGLDLDWMDYRRGSAVILSGSWSNFNRVQTITRTVVNKASNDGAYEIFQQNRDVLMGYRWLAARDERVCPICLGLNGRMYSMDDVFRPPAHHSCRCTITPAVALWVLASSRVLGLPPGLTLEEWEAQMGAVPF